LKRNFEYNVCNWCLRRQFIKNFPLEKIVDDCEICHGIEKQIDKMCNKIVQATKAYEYDTLLIGLILDHTFYDNEDKFRSRFKIRGKENIKTSLLREIRMRFSNISRKKIDLNSPDITVNLQIGKKFEMLVSVRSSTVVLSGRYKKTKRFQTMTKNSYKDDYLEIYQHDIENTLKKKLTKLTDCESIIFWPLGKEEAESLVLGNGRPFYVTIKNSKIVSFKHDLSIRSDGITFNMNKKVSALPTYPPLYINKVRSFVSCKENLKSSDLKLINDAGIRIIEFSNKRNKNWKLIYQMQGKLKSQKKLELLILCDNGFPIKKFIDGDENVSPNLGQILNKKCNCDIFDILDIISEDDLLN
jgi:tRNA pseudouridine synthase 10